MHRAERDRNNFDFQRQAEGEQSPAVDEREETEVAEQARGVGVEIIEAASIASQATSGRKRRAKR